MSQTLTGGTPPDIDHQDCENCWNLESLHMAQRMTPCGDSGLSS